MNVFGTRKLFALLYVSLYIVSVTMFTSLYNVHVFIHREYDYITSLYIVSVTMSRLYTL
jgi:hypothetical protein